MTKAEEKLKFWQKGLRKARKVAKVGDLPLHSQSYADSNVTMLEGVCYDFREVIKHQDMNNFATQNELEMYERVGIEHLKISEARINTRRNEYRRGLMYIVKSAILDASLKGFNTLEGTIGSFHNLSSDNIKELIAEGYNLKKVDNYEKERIIGYMISWD